MLIHRPVEALAATTDPVSRRFSSCGDFSSCTEHRNVALSAKITMIFRPKKMATVCMLLFLEMNHHFPTTNQAWSWENNFPVAIHGVSKYPQDELWLRAIAGMSAMYCFTNHIILYYVPWSLTPVILLSSMGFHKKMKGPSHPLKARIFLEKYG